MIVDARRLDPDLLGQIAIAETVVAPCPHQRLGQIQQLSARIAIAHRSIPIGKESEALRTARSQSRDPRHLSFLRPRSVNLTY